MPAISLPLPTTVRNHLILRWKERTSNSTEDFVDLQTWLNSGIDLPEGRWHKKFKTFILMGEGEFPKTIYNHNMNIDPESEEVF